MVRLDLMEPIAKHATAMTVAGRPVFVPLEEVAALCAALTSAHTDADASVDGEANS